MILDQRAETAQRAEPWDEKKKYDQSFYMNTVKNINILITLLFYFETMMFLPTK